MRNLILMLLGIGINAQTLYFYPKGQEFYEGGNKQFYKELTSVLKEKNYKICSKNEALMVKVLVSQEGKVQYVVEEDTLAVSQNRCAYDMAKSSLSHLKHWKPAEVGGKKVKAVARFLFVPNDLILGVEYDKTQYKPIDYKDGKDKVAKSFQSCMNLNDFSFSDFKLKVYFEINTQGAMQFIHVDPYVDNRDFLRMIRRCAGYQDKKWEPASYKGIKLVTPVLSSFNFMNE